jgi:hypothetical protein
MPSGGPGTPPAGTTTGCEELADRAGVPILMDRAPAPKARPAAKNRRDGAPEGAARTLARHTKRRCAFRRSVPSYREGTNKTRAQIASRGDTVMPAPVAGIHALRLSVSEGVDGRTSPATKKERPLIPPLE